MPNRHRSAYRRRQGSQARRRTAITIAIPLALAVVVGGAIAFTDGLTSHVSNTALNCASPAAYVQPAKAAGHHHGGNGNNNGNGNTASPTAAAGTASPTTAGTGAATPTTAGTGAATATTAATG